MYGFTSPKDLFLDLMHLCETDDSFYYKDTWYLRAGYWARVFSYRLASYTSFLKPGALECRGHTFVVDDDGEFVDIISVPFHKFFNLNENPFVMDVSLDSPKTILDKADGSLISTVWWRETDTIHMKSKTSFSSSQATSANTNFKTGTMIISKAKAAIENAVRSGFTVNMEYVSPRNRIVIPYERVDLKILSVRYNEDGSYVDHEDIAKMWPDMYPHLIREYTHFSGHDDLVEWIENGTGFEGVVVRTADDRFVKLKTEWYRSLHRAIDAVDSDKKILETVLSDSSDDFKALVSETRPDVKKRIEDIESVVIPYYNDLVRSVEGFVDQMKNEGITERKDVAIKAKQTLPPDTIPLIMNLWNGKKVDYPKYLMNRHKEILNEVYERTESTYPGVVPEE